MAARYGAGGYIRPIIRLEFGGRNDVWPAEVHAIRPYCLEEFRTLSTHPSCDVNVLAAARTLWEKATLLQLHIVPHERVADALRSDYAQMREMFFDEPEPFDTILNTLRQLEQIVNEMMADPSTEETSTLTISPRLQHPGVERRTAPRE